MAISPNFSAFTPSTLFSAFGNNAQNGALQGLGLPSQVNNFGGINPAITSPFDFNPMTSLMNVALAPTMSSLSGQSAVGGESPFGPSWMSGVINSANLISSGAMDNFTSNLVPQNGFTGVAALNGSNKLAVKYMLEMLAKKDPDSPETDKFAEKIVNLAGGSPEAAQMVAQQQLGTYDNQIAQLINIQGSFPPGSPDADAIGAKIQLLQAKRNNVIINLNINQSLPANSTDLRVKLIREALEQLGSVNPASPEGQQIIQRILTLGGGSPLVQQLAQMGADRSQNNAIIAEYNARFNPPPPVNPLEALGNNPLQLIFGLLSMMMQSGAGAVPAAAEAEQEAAA